MRFYCSPTSIHALRRLRSGSIEFCVQEVDNLTLRRFLRARDHNVDKASAMFLKLLRWRKEVAPDGFVPEGRVRRELSQDKACMGGVDRAGRPVSVVFPARHFPANRDMAEFKSKHLPRLLLFTPCSYRP
jgi:hypothetical protein